MVSKIVFLSNDRTYSDAEKLVYYIYASKHSTQRWSRWQNFWQFRLSHLQSRGVDAL